MTYIESNLRCQGTNYLGKNTRAPVVEPAKFDLSTILHEERKFNPDYALGLRYESLE